MYDCIVVGSGVAGVSAALTLKANGKNFLLMGSPALSPKISRAERIRNYPGLSDVTGEAFRSALQAQLRAAEIPVEDERATGVYAMKGKFSVLTESGKTYEGRTVVLATGVESLKPIAGETEFLGRGVSYCATCDGFLYKGKTVAVLCTSARFEHEIEYLSKLAAKTYVIPLYRNPSPALSSLSNAEILVAAPERIEGKNRAEKIVFKNGESREADGFFILKESLSPAVLVAGLKTTTDGHVETGRDASTNLPGCFAAGDCTGRPYQYAKAAGEGNVAAHSACDYLAKNPCKTPRKGL